jgi:hypothetical protein
LVSSALSDNGMSWYARCEVGCPLATEIAIHVARLHCWWQQIKAWAERSANRFKDLRYSKRAMAAHAIKAIGVKIARMANYACTDKK